MAFYVYILRCADGSYYTGHTDDIEAGMAKLTLPVRAVLPKDDWLAPRSSVEFLLSKMGAGERDVRVLDGETLGAPANHFSWMKLPKGVADLLRDGNASLA